MQWENLTAPDFERAVGETGVCILAMGVLERHSDHMPLGTDFLNGHWLACTAAEREPAVVFPPFYFGQIYEARCFPGALTIRPELLVELLRSVLDEIGRNGFKKIIIVNAHGGNTHLIPFLAQSSLWERKSYSLYWFNGDLGEERAKKWAATVETPLHGHACECETSITLANFPALVKMEAVPAAAGGSFGADETAQGGLRRDLVVRRLSRALRRGRAHCLGGEGARAARAGGGGADRVYRRGQAGHGRPGAGGGIFPPGRGAEGVKVLYPGGEPAYWPVHHQQYN